MATVLVVEDHDDTLRMMLKIVSCFGYRASGAGTGEAGLALIASEKPDIIIVDGMMPGMDGHEFICLCRANPLTAAIPIILHSAVTDPEFGDDAFRKGASEVWIKGNVELEQMRGRLAYYLRNVVGDQIA